MDLKQNEQKIIKAYAEDLTPIIEIASWFHVSRQAIWKLLRKRGVDTSKSRRFKIICHWCEKVFYKRACQMRRRNYHYCTTDCYLDYLREVGQPYVENRSGQRRARSVVSMCFDLQPENVVHHEDKDTLNNLPFNLRAFKDQSDHMRYHRGGEATPLWDGRDVAEL